MEVRSSEENGVLVVRPLLEQFDYTVCDDIKATLEKLMDNTSASGLVVDLGEVSFMDSKAIGIMVAVRNRAKKKRLRFALCSLHPYVRKIINVVTLDTIFDTFADPGKAVKDMGRK